MYRRFGLRLGVLAALALSAFSQTKSPAARSNISLAPASVTATEAAAEVVAFPDLGPEAIHRLEVEDFPTIVINDCHGGDLYELGRREYARAR
jgi:fumarate hydratase subunit beta